MAAGHSSSSSGTAPRASALRKIGALVIVSLAALVPVAHGSPAAATSATTSGRASSLQQRRLGFVDSAQHVSPASLSAARRSPLPAATVSGGDPAGDTSPTSDCHPDILAYAGDYTDNTVAVGHQVSCGSDPTSDPSWTVGVTGILWAIDVNADSSDDYEVFYINAGGVNAEVRRTSDFVKMCDATPGWDGNAIFTATFDASCIGSPASFRMQAFMVWDEAPNSSTCSCPADIAPDGSTFSSDIARSSSAPPPPPPPPPPTGYQTACEGASALPDAFADAGLAADCLKAYGIALGKADGTFGENDQLLRSQVSSLLARMITTNGSSLTARRAFPDVNADTVPNPQVRDEIEHLAGVGIIAGYPDGTFGPAGTLSVAQAATFVVRTLAFLHQQHPSFPAFQDQGTTASNYDYATSQGILDKNAKDINGATYASGPSDVAMRGLLADILAQSLEKLGKVFYATCTDAQSAGVAPMHIGDSGYRPALDPDGDGTECATT